MAHIIAEPCIGTKDTACVAVCPADCIHPTKDEADFAAAEMLYIDNDICIDCGLCVDECPVKAIFPQEDLPAEWNNFIEKNAAYFKKQYGQGAPRTMRNLILSTVAALFIGG